ncbi:PREDICTED: uncharacterized protein LOC105557210, partial [Vollenhovia emeryi]|uniref:uncharacterized protein LOC105557210 n=1 Tax=Vollenhovia emeryi TaxID=411798 RepID=UPI0005F4B7B5
MSIKPGLQYDNSISAILGRPTMKLSSGADACNQLATHSLVFMLCGISTKWKQTIGYEYTANSFCPEEMVRKIMTIVEKAHANGIIIKVVLSDMGSQNRSWWRLLNITANKYSKIQNYIQHPCNNEDKLFIMADSVHVFKNVACSLTAGNTFYLSDTLVEKYNLPHKEISITPIRDVYQFDQKDTLKLCPRLHEKAINPSHFDKMNVALSVGLLNNNVAAAILYHIDRKNIDYKHKSTAWFLSTIHKWFTIMTSRYEKLALSHNNEKIYIETIMFLKEFIEIVSGITIGNGTWKPFQSGLILCTQTVLDIQGEYLDKQNFKYLLVGRFTQDALENLFSTIRGRNSVPDAREFKQALRLISLSQFQTTKNSNYSTVDADYLIQYCKEIKQLERTNISGDIQ